MRRYILYKCIYIYTYGLFSSIDIVSDCCVCYFHHYVARRSATGDQTRNELSLVNINAVANLAVDRRIDVTVELNGSFV